MSSIPKKHRGIPWTQEDVTLLKKLYKEGIPVSRISKKIGRSKDSIRHKITYLNLSNRRSDWTKDEERQIVKLRSKGLGFKEIGKIMNRSNRSVQTKHSRLTTPQKKEYYRRKANTDNYRRVYSVDDNYFSIINSQKKAYYLGFLMADGYVGTHINEKRFGRVNSNKIALSLAIKDLSVLEDFKREINAESPITFRNPKASYYKGRKILGTRSCELRFTSEQMIKDLAQYGIVQNKTYHCKFPNNLPKKYYPGFIAGLISGDGCVNVRKKNKNSSANLRGFLAGTKELTYRVAEILTEGIGYNFDKKILNRKDSTIIFILELNQKETINLYYWFREKGISLMPRKNAIIEDFLEKRLDLKREVA